MRTCRTYRTFCTAFQTDHCHLDCTAGGLVHSAIADKQSPQKTPNSPRISPLWSVITSSGSLTSAITSSRENLVISSAFFLNNARSPIHIDILTCVWHFNPICTPTGGDRKMTRQYLHTLHQSFASGQWFKPALARSTLSFDLSFATRVSQTKLTGLQTFVVRLFQFCPFLKKPLITSLPFACLRSMH